MTKAKRMNRADHKKIHDAAFAIYLELLRDETIRSNPLTNYRDVALESFRQAHEKLRTETAVTPHDPAPACGIVPSTPAIA